jgi:hypothetical protein
MFFSFELVIDACKTIENLMETELQLSLECSLMFLGQNEDV